MALLESSFIPRGAFSNAVVSVLIEDLETLHSIFFHNQQFPVGFLPNGSSIFLASVHRCTWCPTLGMCGGIRWKKRAESLETYLGWGMLVPRRAFNTFQYYFHSSEVSQTAQEKNQFVHRWDFCFCITSLDLGMI